MCSRACPAAGRVGRTTVDAARSPLAPPRPPPHHPLLGVNDKVGEAPLHHPHLAGRKEQAGAGRCRVMIVRAVGVRAVGVEAVGVRAVGGRAVWFRAVWIRAVWVRAVWV